MSIYSQLFLRSINSPYGDFTRNSVLSFKDLDQNFIFLKERDINSINYSSNTLTIETLGGNSFSTTISSGGGGGSGVWTSGSTGLYSIKANNISTIDATANYSVASGFNTLASGNASHAEGESTIASGTGSHTQGFDTTASGDYSHAEGTGTTASGNASHAEGSNTTASGPGSHTQGFDTTASGDYSHAEGAYTVASGLRSHAEGGGTVASGSQSHAEGTSTTASGDYSHAEGNNTIASGTNSHAEGTATRASGQTSHAEGYLTVANGYGSHSGGYGYNNSGQYRIVSDGDSSFTHFRINQMIGDMGAYADQSTILGGLNHNIDSSSTNSAILGGSSNRIVGASGSIVLGGQNITGTTDDTVYVPNLEIRGQAYTPIYDNLTGGTTFIPDWDNSNTQILTLSGNTNVSGGTSTMEGGSSYTMLVKQSNSGSHTITWDSTYKWEAGSPPTLSVADGSVDIITFICDGTYLYGLIAKDFQ